MASALDFHASPLMRTISSFQTRLNASMACVSLKWTPAGVEKLEDIVGLYLSPPEHALVLCCDEKSQVQALDRTQPGLPLKKGRAGTLTHDYKRNLAKVWNSASHCAARHPRHPSASFHFVRYSSR